MYAYHAYVSVCQCVYVFMCVHFMYVCMFRYARVGLYYRCNAVCLCIYIARMYSTILCCEYNIYRSSSAFSRSTCIGTKPVPGRCPMHFLSYFSMFFCLVLL